MKDKTEISAFIDKIEGKYARLIIGKDTIDLPKKLLPEVSAEGQYIKIEISIDKEQSKSKINEIQSLIDELKGNN